MGMDAASHWDSSFYDEGDGLILCEWHSQGYNCTYSPHVCFDLARTDTTVTYKCYYGAFTRFHMYFCLLYSWVV